MNNNNNNNNVHMAPEIHLEGLEEEACLFMIC